METSAQNNENFTKSLFKPGSYCLPSSPPIDSLTQPHAFLSLRAERLRLSHILPVPKLSARWEIENNRLVCRWVVSDRP